MITSKMIMLGEVTPEDIRRRAWGAFPIDDEVFHMIEVDSIEHSIDAVEIARLIHEELLSHEVCRIFLVGCIKYELNGVKYNIDYSDYGAINNMSIIKYSVSLDVPKEEKELITCLTKEEYDLYGIGYDVF